MSKEEQKAREIEAQEQRAKTFTDKLKKYINDVLNEYVEEAEHGEGFEYWGTMTPKEVVEDFMVYLQEVMEGSDTTIYTQEFLAQKF